VSGGHIFIGIGLVLELSGTLFITFDARQGQAQTVHIYEALAFANGIELASSPNRPGKAETDVAVTDALDRVPADASGPLKDVAETLELLTQIDKETDVIAAGRASYENKKALTKMLEKVSDDFRSRRFLIAAAIATVILGCACEFIGGVLLGA